MSDPRDVKAKLALHDRLARLWADDRFLIAPYGHEVRQLAEALDMPEVP